MFLETCLIWHINVTSVLISMMVMLYFIDMIIEQVQYKTALIITGCWQGTSQDKLYDELGWELLSDRWLGYHYFTEFQMDTHSCLSDHIPNRKETHYNLCRKVELEITIIRTLKGTKIVSSLTVLESGTLLMMN